MKSINLIFGCHSHQPVGNFDSVFERAYHQAYVPFVDVLERFPAVRVTLHFTGPLWDWFQAYRPHFIERLARLVACGQVEIMGGGYYEPLLCAIPERDAIAQIGRMQSFCEKHFGERVRGMWLAERVWEPHMARTLAKAGIEYTALDDSHFLCSGLTREDLFGYYLTEDEGQSVKVFPILEKLRYLIPFHQVRESIAFLREHVTEDGLRCAVIHDDGEKFGIWPGTHHSVYEEGWLEEFFQALTENREWLHSVTYSEYLAKAKAVGRTYITCASYQEMMEWALPTGMQRQLHAVQEELKRDPDKAARYGPFIRGGFWRSFLAKYPEANNLQKRMLRVSERVARLKGRHARSAAFKIAEKLLHEGQCNCAYWHGVFGGLYLNHLRTAIYERLIASDAVLDSLERANREWVDAAALDFDADGHEEVILENSRLALFFSPADGGTLFEADYKDKPFNFINTLSRRDEPYHDALRMGQVHVGEQDRGDLSIHEMVKAKEKGLEHLLAYDRYRRVCLRDHFFDQDVSLEDLWRGTAHELGDFHQGSYDFAIEGDTVRLLREGQVRGAPVRVEKKICLTPNAPGFRIQYDIECCGEAPGEVLFGVEFALNLLTGSAFDRYYRSDERDLRGARLGERGWDDNLCHFALRDDWQRLEWSFRFQEAARIGRFAVETVSQSEDGQERVYQGSVVIPCWVLTWASGRTVSKVVDVEVVEVPER